MTSFLTQAREWRREQALFGDTADKDRPSVRGEERGWRWQRGGGKKLPADQFHGSLPEKALVLLERRVTRSPKEFRSSWSDLVLFGLYLDYSFK